MSISISELRHEARLLSDRIADAEMTAHSLRKLVATGKLSNPCEATAQAILAERAALRMATRLSSISQDFPL